MAKNRSHNMIDRLPAELKEAINNAIVNERLTYREITEMINNAGHHVSTKTVERYGKRFIAQLESITRAKEQARSIIETGAGLKLEMAEASSMVAFQMLFDMLLNSEGPIDKNTLSAMRTLAVLEKSAVSREKLKFEFDKGVNAAGEKIKQSLRDELSGDLELAEKLYAMVDEITGEITKPKN